MSTQTYNISFKLQVPADIPFNEVEDWVRYSLNGTGSIYCDNPLYDNDFRDYLYGKVTIDD